MKGEASAEYFSHGWKTIIPVKKDQRNTVAKRNEQ